MYIIQNITWTLLTTVRVFSEWGSGGEYNTCVCMSAYALLTEVRVFLPNVGFAPAPRRAGGEANGRRQRQARAA